MGPLTIELAAHERLKNWCLHVFSVAIDLILFKIASYKDMHKSWTSSNFGQIRTLIAELVALEYLKNIPKSYNGKVMSPC